MKINRHSQSIMFLFVLVLLFVSLFSALPLPTIKQAKATTYFAHGFEGGDEDTDPETGDAWTGTEYSLATLSFVTSPVHHGTYAYRGSTTVSGGYASCYKDFTSPPSTIYARFYINVTDWTGVGDNGYTFFAGWRDTGAGFTFMDVGLIHANRSLYLKYRNSGGDHYVTSGTTLSLSTWYCIELKYVQSTTVGEYRVYLNGTEVEDLTQTSQNADFDALRFRTFRVSYLGSGITVSFVFDCFVIADSYIGEEEAVAVQVYPYSTNTTIAGNDCNFSSKAIANEGNLSYSIFGTNNTGTWINETATAFPSEVTIAWANYTKTLNSTVGVRVEWQVWANNTDDTWGTTGLQYLVTTNPSDNAPDYFDVSHNDTKYGEDAMFCVRWVADSPGTLNYSIFSWNNTGSWVNFTQAMSGNEYWHNTTKTLNDTIGVTVSYKFYANSTTDYWNITNTVNFIVMGGATRPLHTDGRWIKNDLNQNVILKGVNYNRWEDNNVGDLFDPDTAVVYWQTWSASLAEEMLNKSIDWGANVWRLTICIEWWLDDTSSTGYRYYIKQFSEIAADLGVYIVIAPWKATATGSSPGMPYPNSVLADSDDFVDFWEIVADELKYYDNILFDLWNEPAPDSVAESWMGVVNQTIAAIRSTGASNLVVVECAPYNALPDRYQSPVGRWAMDWVEDYPLAGTNIVYSTHLYWDLDPNWDMDSYENIEDGYMNNCYFDYVLNTLDKPIWIGEMGVNIWYSGQDLTDNLFWWNNTLRLMNENNIGYAAWLFFGYGQPYYLFGWTANTPASVSGEILIDALAEEGGAIENSVVLNQPSNGATETSLDVNFNYTATFYEGAIENSSLWLNISGTWQRVGWNTTAITNGTLHTINYTFSVETTYIWNIQVFNSTTSHFAASNYTVTISLAGQDLTFTLFEGLMPLATSIQHQALRFSFFGFIQPVATVVFSSEGAVDLTFTLIGNIIAVAQAVATLPAQASTSAWSFALSNIYAALALASIIPLVLVAGLVAVLAQGREVDVKAFLSIVLLVVAGSFVALYIIANMFL